jgi:polysaccharide export outer membrane protein
MTRRGFSRHALFCALVIAAIGMAAEATAPAGYILGPDDQITMQAPDIEEISGKPMRIDRNGDISLPLIGRVEAAGFTTGQLEVRLRDSFKRYLRKPDISVSITAYGSQPVSVLGAVQNPGVHQLQGNRDLFGVLSLAGGLRPDAGSTVKITRRLKWGRIPLPGAADDATGQFSVASIHIRSILSAAGPADNIAIQPEDVISVPKADLIYAIGAVQKAGGFVLGDQESISALQTLALAGGLERMAAPHNARILRATANSSNRIEIPLDIKKILAGTSADVPLKADDILFIPVSGTKNVALRTFEAAVQIGTGVAIYRR